MRRKKKLEKNRDHRHEQQQRQRQQYYIRFSQFFFLSTVQPVIVSKGILSLIVHSSCMCLYMCFCCITIRCIACRLMHMTRNLYKNWSFCVHALAIAINSISCDVVFVTLSIIWPSVLAFVFLKSYIWSFSTEFFFTKKLSICAYEDALRDHFLLYACLPMPMYMHST